MNFLITNFEFIGANKLGNAFYSGNCIRESGGMLKVRQSANMRFFNKYADILDSASALSPLCVDDFYFVADYCVSEDVIHWQTDLIGYEAAFLWQSDGFFAMSDDVFAIAEIVKRMGKGCVEINEEAAREFLYFSECWFENTIYTNIKRLLPACVSSIEVSTGDVLQKPYDIFKMTGEYSTVEDCAEKLANYLDKYFANNYDSEIKYAIGMSGGLDSRVGAYFAKKHGYRVQPIFIGVKRNAFGMLTNDVKRAIDINNELDYSSIQFYDPRKIDFEDKVEYDSFNSPHVTNNIRQNMGKLNGFDVLIHAMMGGEAFGQLLSRDMSNLTVDELAEALLTQVGGAPKYKTSNKNLIRLSKYCLPNGVFKRFLYTDAKIGEELLPDEQKRKLLISIRSWVAEQKAFGLDNNNIWHKMFYYRIAVIGKTGYYSTINNTVASLGTYLNQGFVRELLKWDSSYLVKKQVQVALIKRLGNLSQFRSQTIEPSIISKDRTNKINSTCYILERIMRGGAMTYSAFPSAKYKRKYISQNVFNSSIWQRLGLKSNVWMKSDLHVLNIIKLSKIERILNEI